MLINPWHFHPPYPEVKCPACGWVHVALPLVEALREGLSRDDLARYYRCFNCRKPTAAFVFAEPEDAPLGCTLQPVVVGVAPDSLNADGQLRTLYCETAPKDGQELLALIELYVARESALRPLKFRILSVDVDEEVIQAVLSAPDPLAAATALHTSYVHYFD